VKRFLSVFVTSMFLASAAFAADPVKDEKKAESAKADAKAKSSDAKADAKAKSSDAKAKSSDAKADAKSDEKKAATK